MGYLFSSWNADSSDVPGSFADVTRIVRNNRSFRDIDKLDYGDHGLEDAIDLILKAMTKGQRIALYADYDVDGTMSCMSWIWFLKSLHYENFVHYIPCRFKEGYGLNISALQYLIEKENADLIVTMDCGITSKDEIAYCTDRGIPVVCTDHHNIQKSKFPENCAILNPKLHPSQDYQELCGAGITFVLLRKLGPRLQELENFVQCHIPWEDILALVGMATICDMVPLNLGVDHKLARMGVAALNRTKRPVLRALMKGMEGVVKDESDVGFRLGPRINAVGRLHHADKVIEAFSREDPEELVTLMGQLNDERKSIQEQITSEALEMAKDNDRLVLVLGGSDWHQGVVGISASKVKDTFWRPVLLYQELEDGTCKGSARSIEGYDIVEAMQSCGELFTTFGGHHAAAGFKFNRDKLDDIINALHHHAEESFHSYPNIWQSRVSYDCHLPENLMTIDICEYLQELKPFGHKFREPVFMVRGLVSGVRYYDDKKTKQPKHTAISLASNQKVMFFNEVLSDIVVGDTYEFLVSLSKNIWTKFSGERVISLNIFGKDYGEIR